MLKNLNSRNRTSLTGLAESFEYLIWRYCFAIKAIKAAKTIKTIRLTDSRKPDDLPIAIERNRYSPFFWRSNRRSNRWLIREPLDELTEGSKEWKTMEIWKKLWLETLKENHLVVSLADSWDSYSQQDGLDRTQNQTTVRCKADRLFNDRFSR